MAGSGEVKGGESARKEKQEEEEERQEMTESGCGARVEEIPKYLTINTSIPSLRN